MSYTARQISRIIKERRVAESRGMREKIKARRTLIGKTKGKKKIGRPGRIWEHNIKMDLQGIE
jgi:hypothetical protein